MSEQEQQAQQLQPQEPSLLPGLGRMLPARESLTLPPTPQAVREARMMPGLWLLPDASLNVERGVPH
jgi:hypothetical protein